MITEQRLEDTSPPNTGESSGTTVSVVDSPVVCASSGVSGMGGGGAGGEDEEVKEMREVEAAVVL